MKNDQHREHWYSIVSAVLAAENNVITDEIIQALKNHELSPEDYIYKVVDEILKYN